MTLLAFPASCPASGLAWPQLLPDYHQLLVASVGGDCWLCGLELAEEEEGGGRKLCHESEFPVRHEQPRNVNTNQRILVT